jgi:hypothetical protein
MIAEKLGLGSAQLRTSAAELCDEVSRMLVAIMKKLKNKPHSIQS